MAEIRSSKLTNVDDMSISINHDVAIVPVLDLKDVARNGICGHRLDKIQPRFLERYSVLATILCDEKVLKVIDFGSTQFITRSGIRNHIDYSTLSSWVNYR